MAAKAETIQMPKPKSPRYLIARLGENQYALLEARPADDKVDEAYYAVLATKRTGQEVKAVADTLRSVYGK